MPPAVDLVPVAWDVNGLALWLRLQFGCWPALAGFSTSSKQQAWIMMRVGCAVTLCAFPFPAGVVTVVDAKHVVRHLDAKPEVDEEPNEAISQIAYADRIILNKTDLVGLVRPVGLPLASLDCPKSSMLTHSSSTTSTY